MGLGDLHRIRGLAGAFALGGVLLYTALIPGHVVSQATAFAFGGDAGLSTEMPCHEGMAVQDTEQDPATPDTPQKKCPFCKGYAAFMTALAGASDAGTIDAEHTRITEASLDEGPVERASRHTHNRGPPILL